ncbi:hypothetical protein [Falsibacillus albus]|uniref:DUF3221 domain-containing protein n=1 Tax=Falsibacillus albus TaxID=2478915 RepID=A0A3L7JUQ9_9BACI|nr:hypothetical protein [Falsibacillus albus]RLQ94617.1 hypothetical protein D9X91_13870 [Falsibacillus albus]
MKRKLFIFSILLLLLNSGCSVFAERTISKEQAKSIVLKRHSGSIGEVHIISITHEWNAYIVKWENKKKTVSMERIMLMIALEP